jgi:hypothetical protein
MKYYLYHYYEYERGPFKNLSSLSEEKAEEVFMQLRQSGDVFASKRSADYLLVRRELESRAREMFVAKGGKPKKQFPHYMTLGECEWIRSWYKQGCEIQIDLVHFDPDTLSFTYGDLFPTMRYNDGKPYRGKIYTLDEIKSLIEKYGMPQVWNRDGTSGPERYIEVQVWDDQVIRKHVL